MTNKDTLKEILQQNIVSVSFKKIDGTVRDMVCTLKEDILPKLEKKTNLSKAQNENVLPVWDIEKKAFRSFRIDSVVNYAVQA